MNTKDNITLNVTEIQRFCMHDGDGVRTTVFLKGCPLRCAWCHNPETKSAAQQILFYDKKCIMCGACAEICPNSAHILRDKEHIFDRSACIACGACVSACCASALEFSLKKMTIVEIMNIVEKDSAFYLDNGGVTLSGGEPMAQPEGTVSLLREAKRRGIGTALETCGYFDEKYLPELTPLVDCFLWDIKDTNDARHREYTGVSNEKILSNLTLANELGARIRLRCILVNGVNTDKEHYKRISDIAAEIKNLDGVDFIPYHAYAGTKATHLGLSDNGRKDWIPSPEQIDTARGFEE